MAEKNTKRNEILDAARALFKEKGFHKTKMEEIAIAAGVGKGTLYEYFKSKQEIFDEVCVGYVKSIYEYVVEIKDMDLTFMDKIILLFKGRNDSLNNEFEKNPIDYIVSLRNIISEKFVLTMFKYVKGMNSVIIEMIDQGKNEGIVRNDISSEMIACSIVGTMSEYYKNKLNKGEYGLNKDDMIFDLLFHGFSTK